MFPIPCRVLSPVRAFLAGLVQATASPFSRRLDSVSGFDAFHLSLVAVTPPAHVVSIEGPSTKSKPWSGQGGEGASSR